MREGAVRGGGRRVLLVAPFFPPSAMPPSHRMRQFATYLPRHGWEPVVLTVEPRFYAEPCEPDLLGILPPGLRVIRTRALPPKWPAGRGLGDLGLRSLLPFARVVDRLCRRGDVDAVVLSCPPNYTLLLGQRARRHGVPFVLDYQDPWVSEWVRHHARLGSKLWLSHRLAVALEPLAVRGAAGILGVSRDTHEAVALRHGLDVERITLPFGGEPELFQDDPVENGGCAGRLRILALGAMWPAALAGLREAVRRRPALRSRLRVWFVGTSYLPDPAGHFQVLPEARKAGVGELVEEDPRRVPFLEAVRRLREADLLLLIGSVEPHYVPSRLMSLLLARRPLLAIAHPESDAAALLRSLPGVEVLPARPENVTPPEAVAAALLRLLEGDRRPHDRPPDPAGALDAWLAPELVGRLAALLDRAARARRPLAAASAPGREVTP